MLQGLFTLLTLRLMDVAGSASGGAAGITQSSTASTPVQDVSAGSSSAAQQQTQTTNTTTAVQDPNSSDPAYGNWKALRDQHNAAKTRVTELEGQVGSFTKLQTSAQTIATSLGYTVEDFAEAFAADPIKTIALLQQQQAEAAARQGQQQQQGDKSIQDLVKEAVEAQTKPVSEFVNTRMTETAMAKYESTLGDAIKADAIISTAPAEVQELVKDYLGEYFASQPEVLAAMKTKGDYSAVQPALAYISGRLHTAFTKWLSSTNGASQTGAQQTAVQANRSGRRPSLDDIIADPGVLGSQYGG